MQDALLQMCNITKLFPGIKALDEVNIELKHAEVLALLGENGAGKSTLMKILAGVYQPDSGDIFIEGRKVKIEGPKHSQSLGISIIYQEFNLIPYLSVAENIFLGRMPYKAKGIIHWPQLHAQTRELLDQVGLHQLSPKKIIAELSVAEQQLVEIAKALSFASKVIIMDEPTAALNDEDTNKLFAIMDRFRKEGIGIIFITHRLEEVGRIADRITVLRDGRYIGTANSTDISKEEIVKMMVGRDITELFPVKSASIGDLVLDVQNLTIKGKLDNVTMQVHKGEIIGIAGLMGSGRTELSKALFGLYKDYRGVIKVEGREVKMPRDAIDRGIALVTDNRKQEGLVLIRSVFENLLLPATRRISFFGVLRKRVQSEIVQKWVNRLKIKVHDPRIEVGNLSGGNQQKVVLGKWLQMNPKILILNEPTRGIDIGAKAEIYQLMRQLTESGIAIIMISSEMPELLGMSNRILVMHEGKIAAEWPIEEVTQEKIFVYASGGKSDELYNQA